MIITAIKYQVVNEDKPRLFRFAAGSGALRPFLCHQGTPQELEDFLAALLFALKDERHPRIQDTILHAHDASGEAWIVEKTLQKTRVFRNRQPIVDKPEETFRQAMLDLDVIAKEGSEPTFVRTLELADEDEHIAAFPLESESRTSGALRQEIKTRVDAEIDRLREYLQTKSFMDAQTAQKLADGLEPLHHLWRELKEEEKKLADEHRRASAPEPEMIARVEAEIALMEKLATKAAPLLDPGRSPVVLKEKLTEVDGKLTSLCRKNDIRALPQQKDDVPWEKLIQVLSRLKAYEELEKAYATSMEQIDGKLIPIFEEYVATIDQLLQHDTQMTSELECCLATLTMQVKKTVTDDGNDKGRFKAWLDRQRAKHAPKSNEKALIVAEKPLDDRLENARMAVDYALGRLGELHSNLVQADSLHLESKNTLREFHDKVVMEHGKLRKNWELLAQRYQLPETASLKSLLGILQNFGQITELTQKSEGLRRDLRQYKSELSDLEALVTEWRHVTGSQKQTPLDTPSILLGEARGILEYREQKQAQLKKWKENETRVGVTHQLIQGFKRRQVELQNSWRQVFERLALPLKDVAADGWPEFFVGCRRVVALSTLARETLHALKNDKIFTPGAVLDVFLWKNEVSYARTRELVIRLLEKAAPQHDGGLFLISDPVLVELLKKAGATTSHPVEPSRKKPEAHAAAATAVKPPLLSDRAQAALRVFQTQQKKTPPLPRD